MGAPVTKWEFIDCRDRGHAWFLPGEPVWSVVGAADATKLTAKRFGPGWTITKVDVLRTLECWRCGTRRRELFSRSGIRIKNTRYDYATGYLRPGEGRHGRSEFRQVAVKAALKALKGR